MASITWPNPAYNSGVITTVELEQLTAPNLISGLDGTPADPVLVYADGTGLHVKLRAGRTATVRSAHYDSGPVDLVVNLGANSSGVTRVDLIVLRLDRATGQVAATAIAGTPGAGAPPPSQGSSTIGFWDLPLATATVPSGASTIIATQVTDRSWCVSGSGVLCKLANLPTPTPGLLASIYENGDLYVGASATGGPVWKQVQSSGVAVSATIGGGFISVANSTRKISGVTYVNIQVRRNGGTVAAGRVVTLATLPSGYAPPFAVRTPAVVAQSSNVYPAWCLISPSTGVITINQFDVDIIDGADIYLPMVPYPAS